MEHVTSRGTHYLASNTLTRFEHITSLKHNFIPLPRRHYLTTNMLPHLEHITSPRTHYLFPNTLPRLELLCAERVADVFYRVTQTVRVVVRRVDTPA